MFPIRDHNPSRGRAFVTWALIAANVLVFLSYRHLFADPQALARFFFDWGLVPRAALIEPSRFLTSIFLHGGWLHLGGNMLFLWIFGDNLEDEMGHGGFLGFYLAGGVLASAAQWLADPLSLMPVVGASGAIAAVMGGYLLMFPRARVDILIFLVILIRIVPVPAGLVLTLWFGMQLFSGTMADAATGGVAYWAHAGGFVAGVALTLPLWLRRGGPAFWARFHGQPPHAPAESVTQVPRVVRRR